MLLVWLVVDVEFGMAFGGRGRKSVGQRMPMHPVRVTGKRANNADQQAKRRKGNQRRSLNINERSATVPFARWA